MPRCAAVKCMRLSIINLGAQWHGHMLEVKVQPSALDACAIAFQLQLSFVCFGSMMRLVCIVHVSVNLKYSYLLSKFLSSEELHGLSRWVIRVISRELKKRIFQRKKTLYWYRYLCVIILHCLVRYDHIWHRHTHQMTTVCPRCACVHPGIIKGAISRNPEVVRAKP